jgi:hypothetical protein
VSFRVPGRTFECLPGLGNNQRSLGDMDAPMAVCQRYLGLVLKEFCRVVTTDPEELRSNSLDFLWELSICVTITGLFSILLLLWRSFQFVRS